MTPLLDISNVTKTFSNRGRSVTAVDDVDLAIGRGTTHGLVGESGSGKSTLGRIAVLLLVPDRGQITFSGSRVDQLDPAALRLMRRKFQYVFQDAAGAMNPRMTVGQALREPLLDRAGSAAGLEVRVDELLDLVELGAGMKHRYPHQLSGGQVQRAGIARALTVDPEFIVLDEPTSALDVSVQAQLFALFADLQNRLGLTYLLISHDLSVVGQVAERTAVMYSGRIVETGPTAAVLTRPRHPYTARLVESIPSTAPEAHMTLEAPTGVVPRIGAACAFYDRCRHPGRDERCRLEAPSLTRIGPGSVACHHATGD